MAYNNQVPEITKEKNYLTSSPIFTWYNEKSAVFNLLIAPNGSLAVSMSPSMLRGQNTGKQHIVEKGTKIYDYKQEAYSGISYTEAIQLRDYMEPHVDPTRIALLNGVCGLLANATSTNVLLNALISAVSTNGSLNGLLADATSRNANIQGISEYLNGVLNKINSKSPTDKGVTIFRSRNTAVPKNWNFNFSMSPDGVRELFYVSVIKNNDKTNKVYTSMGESAFIPMYYALDSYIRNHAMITFIANLIGYEDAELQMVKVGIFKQLIGDIYGKDLERCSNPSDKNMIAGISQGMAEALLKSMIASKNLWSYTGAPTYGNQQQAGDFNAPMSSSEIPF